MTTRTFQHCPTADSMSPLDQLEPMHMAARTLRLCSAVALIVGSSLSHADHHRPNAGEYEVTTTSNFNDLPVTMTTTNCITVEDLDQDPAKIFADTAAAENCELESFEMTDGIMAMRMVCNSDDSGLEMNTEGTYTDSSYFMNSTIEISAGDTRMTTEATVSGTRIGDCEG
jgi:hypothetical protein